MKALTIHQPWASLIAHGQKRYETRSWATGYRGPVAIHAGLSRVSIEELLDFDPQSAGMMAHCLGLASVRDLRILPFGALVAVGELVGVYATDLLHPRAQERAFGNFGPNRYAWEIANVQLLPKPIPMRGAQGLWEWEPPVSMRVGFKLRLGKLHMEVEHDDD